MYFVCIICRDSRLWTDHVYSSIYLAIDIDYSIKLLVDVEVNCYHTITQFIRETVWLLLQS